MHLLVAAALSVYLAFAAMVPHVHVGGHGTEACAVCVARGGAAASAQTPDVAPASAPVGQPVLEPGPPPVDGAPLGAIPGQSPPRA